MFLATSNFSGVFGFNVTLMGIYLLIWWPLIPIAYAMGPPDAYTPHLRAFSLYIYMLMKEYASDQSRILVADP